MNLNQSNQDQQSLSNDFGSTQHHSQDSSINHGLQQHQFPTSSTLNYHLQHDLSEQSRNLANQLAKQKSLIDEARNFPRLTEANAPASYWAQHDNPKSLASSSTNGYNRPVPPHGHIVAELGQNYPTHHIQPTRWNQAKADAWSTSAGPQNQPAIVRGRWPAQVQYHNTIGLQPDRGYTSNWRVAKHLPESGQPNLGRRLRPGEQAVHAEQDVAELDPNPDELIDQSMSPNGGDESAAQEQDYNGNTGTGSGSQEEPQEEHEEQAGRRSFSEEEEDASERDKLGKPVLSFHKHLINGRPVKRAKMQKDSSSDSRPAQGADFEGVANEIEAEGASDDYDVPADESSAGISIGAKPSESRIVGKRLKLDQSKFDSKHSPARDESEDLEEASNGSDGGTSGAGISREDEIDDNSGEREPEKKHVEHKHDMKESLKAQQWDDDSATANKPKSNNAQAAEKPDEDQDSNSDDDGDIQFEDLDLLANSNNDFMNRNETSRRRKRDTTQIMPLDSMGHYSNISEPSRNLESHQLRYREPGDDRNLGAPMDQVYNDGRNWPTQNYSSTANEFGPNQPINIGLTAGTSGFYTPAKESSGQLQSTPSGAPSGVAYGAPEVELQVAPPNSINYAPQSMLFGPQFGGGILSPFASGSVTKKKNKKIKLKKKMKKKSEKVKYGKGHSFKKKAKLKHGGMKKKKHKAKRKMAKDMKMFQGSTKGNKGKKGEGHRGAKKGIIFYKDKGYKKKGFKKAYQKLESGDHKTYFDEYRDKNHNKKWKNFKDKHKFR